MILYGTNSPKFKDWRNRQSAGKENGAYYYSKEIEDNILPKIKAGLLIVTAGAALYSAKELPDGCVVVCHDNRSTKKSYGRLFGKNIIWVCSKHSTVATLEGYGEKAVYVPLSIDTEYVKKFKRRKTKDIAYVGNAWAFKRDYLNALPNNIEQLSDMSREKLLKEMAKYKNVIAEGRVYLEAMTLGCKVELPKYENITVEAPELFGRKRPLDNRDAIPAWREALQAADNHSCILRATREFNDLTARVVRRHGDVFSVSPERAKELLNNKIKIVEEL